MKTEIPFLNFEFLKLINDFFKCGFEVLHSGMKQTFAVRVIYKRSLFRNVRNLTDNDSQKYCSPSLIYQIDALINHLLRKRN